MMAKAGEGTIYSLAHRANLVAKVFHPDLASLDEKIAKVTAMVGTVPPGAVLDDGFVVQAWPQQLVYYDGAPDGFLMRRIDTVQAVEIHSLSNPAHRRRPTAVDATVENRGIVGTPGHCRRKSLSGSRCGASRRRCDRRLSGTQHSGRRHCPGHVGGLRFHAVH
ncbi:hypothetical protein ABQE93_08950 [Mycolicibacterium sp. XJ662]